MSTVNKFADLHEFDRLSYFYGQTLGVRDFKDEQKYFREKMKLHHRFLHGHGVVCGLEVSSVAMPFSDPMSQDQTSEPKCSPKIKISAGLAIDEEGNELLVRHEACVELWKHLSTADKNSIQNPPSSPVKLYISLEYRELEIEPTQSVLPAGPYARHDCEFARRRDSFCVKVTCKEPEESHGCGCCDGPASKSVLLAVVHWASIYNPNDITIDNSVRRPLGLRRTTRIDGINWVHNGSYTTEEVIEIWKTGLIVHFTAPVHQASIVPGIMDVMIFQGGGRISGAVQYLNGDIVGTESINGMVHGLHYHFDHKYREFLSDGDRVHIILRSSFLLDKCCQPIDGLHVGGWVPLLEKDGHKPRTDKEEIEHPWRSCHSLRQTYGLLTSGNGTPGHNFESWFHVNNLNGDRKS